MATAWGPRGNSARPDARVASPAIRKSETISETRTYPTTRFTVKARMSRLFPAPPDQQDLSKFADCAGSSDDSFEFAASALHRLEPGEL